jgi:galactokinase
MATGLTTAGMSSEAAARAGTCFEALATTLRALRAESGSGALDAEPHALWVPGRVELLGKHTDYAGGRSLLCATERGLCVLAAARRDRRVRVHDARCGETVTCDLDAGLVPRAGHWSAYPAAVARRVARNFPCVCQGVDLVFSSDLPSAAGMSSSSALVVASFLVLARVNDLAHRVEYRRNVHTREELAGYLGAVENGQSFGALAGDTGVGTFGGSEDHTAILCSRAGVLVQYRFCPVHFERAVTFPADYQLVIATSGVRAEKTGAARDSYNHASLAMRAILDRWRQCTGRDDATVPAAIASSDDALDRMRACLRETHGGPFPTPALLDRLAHFLEESDEILPATSDAIARHDLERVGVLVDRSQQGAERLLGNQIPETIALARSARTLGAAAASAFGAGFGGSVWALVASSYVATFRARWAATYATAFPEPARHAEIFATRAGPPATWL